MVSWAYVSLCQISRFYDTGKCIRPYFALRQGPLALPLEINFEFSNFFLWFHELTYRYAFILLRYREVLVLDFAPGHKFWVFWVFSFSSMGDYKFAKFQLPRPSGMFYHVNLWQFKGPLALPLDINFGFSECFLWFGGNKPYHYAKFQLPRPSRNAPC